MDYLQSKNLHLFLWPLFVSVFRVLDTKFMCNSSVFKQLIPSSVLAHVLEKIQQEPFSLPEVGECKKSQTASK